MKKDTTLIFRVNTELKEKVRKIAGRNNVKLGSLLNAYLMDTAQRDMIPINIRSKIRVFERNKVSIPEIKKALNKILSNAQFKNKVYSASLFGSYARGEERGDSDIDIVISPNRSTFNLYDLTVIQDSLENAIGKKVDVITRNGLDNDFLKELIKDEIPLYSSH